MTAIRSRLVFLFPLLGIGLASLLLIGISQAQAQEGTPTPEPEEIPLAPTPMAPPEEPPMQAMAQSQQSSTPSEDRIIDDEPDNSIRPVVAYSAQGDVYLAVWQDAVDFVPTNIFARYVDAQGNPLGTRFRVAGPRPGRVRVKVVAGGGIFSIFWQEGEDQYRASVYAQRLDGSFTDAPLLGSALPVQTPVEDQFHAVFNPDRNEFLVVWLDPRNSVLASYLRGEVYGKRMTPGGSIDPAEANFTPVPTNPSLNDILNAPSAENDLSAAYNPGLTQYLLTYGTYYCTNLNCMIREEVRARRIDAASLARIGNPIFVTPNPNRIQWAARALYDPRLQQYAVFWNDNRTLESDMGIYAQKISAQGSLVGTNSALISESGSQVWPEVAYLNVESPLPRFFLAWEDQPTTIEGFARGAFLSPELTRQGDMVDLSSETDSIQRVPMVASTDSTSFLDVWQHTRPGLSSDVHAQLFSALDYSAPKATVLVLHEDGTSILPWNALAGTFLYVEARVPTLGAGRPDTLEALISAEESGRDTLVPLTYETTNGLQDIYRSQQLGVSQLVDRPTERTVAAVVNAAVEDEYAVAVNFMDILDISAQHRRGIAWGTGSESSGRPPASLEFFNAAGYENARATIPGYRGFDDFFIKNQADVFFYVGEGWHGSNRLVLLDGKNEEWPYYARPDLVGSSWSDVETVFLLGCSVLDIDNLEGLAGADYSSPGRAWAEMVPGPDTWLGFQWKAPLVGPQRGELAAYELAQRIALGSMWINAWRGATGWNVFPLPPHSFPTAVAIDLSGEGDYFHWHPWIEELPERLQWIYTWESWPRSKWGTSSAGLEIAVASPVQVHVYDIAGRHVGPNATGGYDADIPGSSSFVAPAMINDQNGEAERVSIRPADLSSVYEVQLIGTADGEFDFALEVPDRSGGVLFNVAYMDVPVTQGMQFSLSLERSTDFTLWQDQDGDGEFETPLVPTDVSSRTLDLPVTLTLSGTPTEYGSFASDVTATLGVSTRPNQPAIISLEYDRGEGWQTYDQPLLFSGTGEHLLRYRGLFADGRYDVTQEVVIRIEPTNTAPTADAGSDQTVVEGIWVTLSAEQSSDPDGDQVSYLWDVASAEGSPITLVSPTDVTPQFLASDNGAYTLRVTVDDGQGGIGNDEVLVVVENAAPSIETVSAPLTPSQLGTVVEVSASFSDPGLVDAHTATWAWGDGTTSGGLIAEDGGMGTVAGDHTYASAGVYTLGLTVTDDDAGVTSTSFRYLVVYNPDGGFVTGGGWFYTPEGSYLTDPSFTSKAHFGFNTRYPQGASLPSGEMQLTLGGGELTFHSEEYEWLVISGSHAQMRGAGSLDGEDGYGFLVTLIDAGASGSGEDMIRIRIWETGTGQVIYDTQGADPDDVDPAVPLGGGSIVIHESH